MDSADLIFETAIGVMLLEKVQRVQNNYIKQLVKVIASDWSRQFFISYYAKIHNILH